MIRLFTAAALAAALATPAAAQVAGTYSGSSEDGQGVSFTVGTDGNNVLALTGTTIFFNASCKPASSGVKFNTGWGFGLDSTFTDHKASFLATNPYFVIAVKLTFSADGQGATGTVSSITPMLTPGGPKPKKALYCKAPTQPLSVTLQPPSARIRPTARGPVLLDQQGRPVAQAAG